MMVVTRTAVVEALAALEEDEHQCLSHWNANGLPFEASA
jgi:hypothetical protein